MPTFTVTSPFSLTVIAELERSDSTFVESTLTQAHELWRARDAWLPRQERIAILERTAELMSGQTDSLSQLIASEGGKPRADADVEVARAIDGVRIAVDLLRHDAGEVIPMGMNQFTAGRAAFTVKDPIGVVVAVSAFNHPLNLIVHQVAPAVAAGCPVIVKPSEDTPLSCLRFVELLREAGLPKPWCVPVITDAIPVAERLVTDPRVAFLSFIGSARVGWMLRAKLAPGTRCALEHGGAAPLILAPDARLDAAVTSVLKGGFYHAGQVCVSVQRVFAAKLVARSFAERLAVGAANLVVGDPMDAATEVGPLIRPREVARVDEWVREAVEGGAEVLTGGKPLGANLYAPTVLMNPPEEARVSREEIFGPVVCVYEYDRLDDAIERANGLPVAFQAAVFTQDIDLATAVARRLDASAVMINDHTAFRTDGMPFAGLRLSGLGTGGIPYTLRDMQVEKLIVLRSEAL